MSASACDGSPTPPVGDTTVRAAPNDPCKGDDWTTAAHRAPSAAAGPWKSGVRFTMIASTLSIQTSEGSAPYAVHEFSTRRIRIAPDGSADIRDTARGWRFVGDRDRRRWLRSSHPSLSYLNEGHTHRLSVSSYDFASLEHPVDLATMQRWNSQPPIARAALLSWLARSPGESQGVLERVGLLLGTAPVGKDLEKVLLSLLVQLGVECRGAAVDQLGREGVLLGLDGPEYDAEIVLDSRTGRNLENRRVAYGPLPFADSDHGELLVQTAFVGLSDNV
jgi:hypothetical protein